MSVRPAADRSAPPPSSQSPTTRSAASAGAGLPGLGRLLRGASAFALLAVVFGQGIAPAIKVSGIAPSRVVEVVDLISSFCSQLFTLMAVGFAVAMLLAFVRNSRLSVVIRVLLVVHTVSVFVIGVPSARVRLPLLACVLLALAVSVGVVCAVVVGFREPRSRSLGLLLSLFGLGGVLRVVAEVIDANTWSQTTDTQLEATTVLATGSVVVHAVGLLFALTWLSSRGRRVFSLGSILAMLFAGAVSGISVASNSLSPSWMVFTSRFQEMFAALPASAMHRSVDEFVSILSLAVAVVAIFTRRQVPSVIGAMALVLIAGTSIDMPGRALIMALASLSTVMAALDDRGMWDALAARSPITHQKV